MFFCPERLAQELQDQPKSNQQAQHQGEQATPAVIPGTRFPSFASTELVVHIVVEDIIFGHRLFPFAGIYMYFNMG